MQIRIHMRRPAQTGACTQTHTHTLQQKVLASVSAVGGLVQHVCL